MRWAKHFGVSFQSQLFGSVMSSQVVMFLLIRYTKDKKSIKYVEKKKNTSIYIAEKENVEEREKVCKIYDEIFYFCGFFDFRKKKVTINFLEFYFRHLTHFCGKVLHQL